MPSFKTFAAVLVLTGSACGLSGGFIRDSLTTNQFDYRMEIEKLRYVRLVQGNSSIGSVLCLIPLGDQLYTRAMEDLYASAALQENEVVVNLREDSTVVSYVGVYCISRLTVSGDVVQLVPRGGTSGAAK